LIIYGVWEGYEDGHIIQCFKSKEKALEHILKKVEEYAPLENKYHKYPKEYWDIIELEYDNSN